MNYDQLIEFIKKEMKAQGITQAELSRRTLIYPTTIGNYLTFKRIMPVDFLLPILQALGKTLVIADGNKLE